jgi:hypothetical protein
MFIANRALIEAFRAKVSFFSNFGGNPAIATVGLAVLNVLEDEASWRTRSLRWPVAIWAIRYTQIACLIAGIMNIHISRLAGNRVMSYGVLQTYVFVVISYREISLLDDGNPANRTFAIQT